MPVLAYQLRLATREDRPALATLIARSARALSVGDYRPEQIEGALQAAFGVDSQLIDDGTYFVAETIAETIAETTPGIPALIGCGGWSRRHFRTGRHRRRKSMQSAARKFTLPCAPEHGTGTETACGRALQDKKLETAVNYCNFLCSTTLVGAGGPNHCSLMSMVGGHPGRRWIRLRCLLHEPCGAQSAPVARPCCRASSGVPTVR